MSQQVNIDAVHRTVTVPASQEKAFEVFTAKLGTWWPREYSIGEADMADFVLEPQSAAGGMRSASTARSATPAASRRSSRPSASAWHLNETWQFDPDPDHASEVEIRFVAEGDAQTRVEVEHRRFERHGAGAQGVRGGVDNPQGWSYCLELFSKAVA